MAACLAFHSGLKYRHIDYLRNPVLVRKRLWCNDCEGFFTYLVYRRPDQSIHRSFRLPLIVGSGAEHFQTEKLQQMVRAVKEHYYANQYHW